MYTRRRLYRAEGYRSLASAMLVCGCGPIFDLALCSLDPQSPSTKLTLWPPQDLRVST